MSPSSSTAIASSGYLLPLIFWLPLGAGLFVAQALLTWLVFRPRGRALLGQVSWMLAADLALVMLLRHCVAAMGRLDYSEQFRTWRVWLVWLGVLLFPAPIGLWTISLRLAARRAPPPEQRPVIHPALLAALLMWLSGALLSLALGGSYAFAPRPAALTQVEAPISNLSPELDGVRIAVLADLHIGPLMTPARLRARLSSLPRAKADVVVVVGDIIGPRPEYLPVAARLLGEIRAPLGVYVVAGNFDMGAGVDALSEELSKAGVVFLDDDAVPVRRNGAILWLAGIRDIWTGQGNLRQALRRVPKGAACALLSHSPDILPEAAQRGIPLVLSGHLHGGQIVIPFAGPALGMSRFGTRFSWTRGTVEGVFLVVSRGVGDEWVPVRLFCPPEIVVVTLRAQKP